MSRLAWVLSLIPIGGFVAALVISLGFTLPAERRAAALRKEIASTLDAIQEARAAAREVDYFRKVEGPALRAAYAALDRRIPPGDRPQDFWPLFSSLAAKARVRILRCTAATDLTEEEEEEESAPPADGGEGGEAAPAAPAPPCYRTLSFILEVEGPPERILGFLLRIEACPRPISLREVDVQRLETGFLASKGRVTVDVIIRA